MLTELRRIRVPKAAEIRQGDSVALFQFLKSVDVLHGALKSAQLLMEERGAYSELMQDCERLLMDLSPRVAGSSHPLPDAAQLGKCLNS